MTNDVLTARRLQILRYIQRHILEHGRPPTITSIGAACGLAPTTRQAVLEHLRRLQDAGLIEREAGKSRTIRLTPMAGQPFRDQHGKQHVFVAPAGLETAWRLQGWAVA